MDLRKLKTLIDLVSESNISELEIAEADGKVRIVKASAQAAPAAAPVGSRPPVRSSAIVTKPIAPRSPFQMASRALTSARP